MKQLQRVAIIATLLLSSVAVFSQTPFSLLGKLGYQTDAERFGIEVGGRYEASPQVRIAPAVSFFFPKNHNLGFNVDANVQYVIPISGSGLDVYPLVGLNMANNHFSYKGFSSSSTDFGANFGAGLDYSLSSDDFLNFEFKYTLGGWDYATFMIGYGYRF